MYSLTDNNRSVTLSDKPMKIDNGDVNKTDREPIGWKWKIMVTIRISFFQSPFFKVCLKN